MRIESKALNQLAIRELPFQFVSLHFHILPSAIRIVKDHKEIDHTRLGEQEIFKFPAKENQRNYIPGTRIAPSFAGFENHEHRQPRHV